MLRAVVVPTAAARGRPDLAASNGVAALERRAAEAGIALSASVARVVDDGSAADEKTAAEIAAADLVYMPGGDPDLIPAILGSSAAGQAMRDAWGRGATIAGASAGAMALAEWTWTPGGRRGRPGVRARGRGRAPLRRGAAPGVAGERGADRAARGGLPGARRADRDHLLARGGGADWTVAGEGAAHWFALGASTPVVARDGERLSLD